MDGRVRMHCALGLLIGFKWFSFLHGFFFLWYLILEIVVLVCGLWFVNVIYPHFVIAVRLGAGDESPK